MRCPVGLMLGTLLLSPAADAQIAVPAAPIDRPMPAFPDAVGNIEGLVKLHFTIDKTGHVINAVPFESTPPGIFDATAVAAMANWTYKPRIVDGQPVDQPDNAILIRFKPEADHPPIWVDPSPAYYPREAYDAKAEGTVTVGFDLNELGMVSNVHALTATLPGVFDAEAVRNVQNRVYRPMTVNGIAVKAPSQTTSVDFKLANAKIAPKAVDRTIPPYPMAAEHAGVIGYCAVEFTIAPDGAVSDAKVVAAYPSGMFEQSTLGAVKKWVFEPARFAGDPVATKVHYNFNFRFKDVPEKENHYLKAGDWIKLDFTLLANGHTSDVVVVDQSSPDLPRRKAVDQIKGTIFEPIMKNGHAIDAPNQTITVH